ncbi:hypothetical protein Bbelb_007630 [Branchiostoma belcheri]|nr:hypothetical protein Bbelb_007630 [Branchiostoma belcheri]
MNFEPWVRMIYSGFASSPLLSPPLGGLALYGSSWRGAGLYRGGNKITWRVRPHKGPDKRQSLFLTRNLFWTDPRCPCDIRRSFLDHPRSKNGKVSFTGNLFFRTAPVARVTNGEISLTENLRFWAAPVARVTNGPVHAPTHRAAIGAGVLLKGAYNMSDATPTVTSNYRQTSSCQVLLKGDERLQHERWYTTVTSNYRQTTPTLPLKGAYNMSDATPTVTSNYWETTPTVNSNF